MKKFIKSLTAVTIVLAAMGVAFAQSPVEKVPGVGETETDCDCQKNNSRVSGKTEAEIDYTGVKELFEEKSGNI